MPNPTSKLNLVINGVTTSYDIHDANAIPRSGGAVISGEHIGRNVNNSRLSIWGGSNLASGGRIMLYGSDYTTASDKGKVALQAYDGSSNSILNIYPNGTLTLYNNGTTKNLAMQEDTVPRSLGSVVTGTTFGKTTDNSWLALCGGTSISDGCIVQVMGQNHDGAAGRIYLRALKSSTEQKDMFIYSSGTWTWNGTACQILSDQRLKQQITEIDDKLLDAWEDVNLVQFKYNDAVDQKGDSARLHTGYVVQQIDNACKSHNVDISQYGLYCHEEYPEETEEVEVENEDGTKTKEKKVIREASEHYSLRYTEALIVECKYLRRCIARLTARIEELEKGNNTK